jgi:predicted Fe-Mo cluster-binding NifX family protein
MRLAIPSDEKSIEGSVCMSFGRTPYFLIYDTEKQTQVYLENTAATSQGGAGIKAAQMIVDNKVEVLLTPRCGQNAADVIQGANINIFKTTGGSVADNIEAYEKGKLSPLNEIHSGFHRHGGN